MNTEEVLAILGKVGAGITGSHVVYTSDLHGTDYVDKDALYPHTGETSRLCREIAGRFADDNVEVVIAPAIGGVVLSQWVAHHLTLITGREVLAFYAEKETIRLFDSSKGRNFPHLGESHHRETGEFIIKRGGAKNVIPGKRVLVVEDVLTTGGTVKKVVEATRALGGNAIGVGALCNRGGITAADIGLDSGRLDALVNISLDSWTEDECACTGPCFHGVPINEEVGKGREFMARRRP
ncbi:MAG: phosphoribosyltransferase family protein [Candidatus Vogelbacteria bacterium]